jgi:Protein of unknown function (DUF3303)
MLPDGLVYVSGWVVAEGMDRCFQLMETSDPALLDAWSGRWTELVGFEVYPVMQGAGDPRAGLRDQQEVGGIGGQQVHQGGDVAGFGSPQNHGRGAQLEGGQFGHALITCRSWPAASGRTRHGWRPGGWPRAAWPTPWPTGRP